VGLGFPGEDFGNVPEGNENLPVDFKINANFSETFPWVLDFLRRVSEKFPRAPNFFP
jgi:hypothetical protein